MAQEMPQTASHQSHGWGRHLSIWALRNSLPQSNHIDSLVSVASAIFSSELKS